MKKKPPKKRSAPALTGAAKQTNKLAAKIINSPATARNEIIAANPLEPFLMKRGYELRPSGANRVTNVCPVAQHKRGHMCVSIDVSKQVWHCNDCKVGGTVIDWIMHEKNVSAGEAMWSLGGGRKNGSKIVKTYDYTDETGKLLYQVCRYEPKDFKQRRPDGNGDWIWDLQGVKRVLYRLPKVVTAQEITIAEGEKDADNLAKIGIVATCNCGGAGQWRDDYSETLRDKDVVIFRDDDAPGRGHVDQVIESLTGKAKSIKRVTLPDGFHDVSDYIESLPNGTAAESIVVLIDETPELSSLNSYASDRDDAVVDDFPEPLSDVAYHGLAGEIVRRIEPHTEADPAALLIQFLTAFGNAIGRAAHAIADGARHAMNMFEVLVGETSKARKGTALAHVLRVFERADEQWKQNCISTGLSSGEGVIWNVRDPISKIVKDRKSGQYETEIVDAGVADKRLTVTEGEFANVLKVMSREGNTLSPVLRSAWESGNLRSMTKNSPAQATGAHISIIAHVTRDEVRRELNATDQANGFANRFLWLAVRRSKCLPEGGNIESENLNDLVMRLHDAIEFARDAGEVTRSEAARELWRIIYPSLSEGKPGLLGAITARAEAQVMRLSAIYALLDRSTLIQPEHHRAALALWNYCERSAKWIFSTATGDPHADRILSALRAAGTEGMTRKRIYDDVFQRNVNANVMAGTLESLRRSGLAAYRKERTGGKPREIWFAKTEDTQ